VITDRRDDEPQEDGWDVTQCKCGHLTLRLGTLRLDFSPEEFAQLHRLIDGAVEEFQLGAGPVGAMPGKIFMH
jgi:hypothetical protein